MSVSPVTLVASDLMAAIKIAGAVVGKKTTLPVLGCVLVQCEADGLLIRATDLDRWVSARVAATVPAALAAEKVGICVSHRLLAQMVGIAAADLALTFEPGLLRVATGKGVTKLMGLPVTEFPDGPKVPPDDGVMVASSGIAAALKAVRHSTSADPTRYLLTGVLMAADGTCVATDGRRLSRYELGAALPVDEGGVIVPGGALPGLLQVAAVSERVRVYQRDAMLAFTSEDGRLGMMVKLLEGHYPNWRQVVPADDAVSPRFGIATGDALEAMGWIEPLASEKSPGCKLAMAADGTLTISATTPDVGESRMSLSTAGWPGGEMAVAVNAAYLHGVLAALVGLDCERVEVVMRGDLSPLTLHAPGYLEVLMPMRVSH